MFYMFSGPDFLYANAFYSEGDDLCAERAGAGRLGAGSDKLPRGSSAPRSTISSIRWARS